MTAILCKKCGQILAERRGCDVVKNGQILTSQDIDGYIFRCRCGRRRTYYLREEGLQDRDKTPTDGVITA